MDVQTVNNLGGACSILGVVLVVRDLLSISQYRGELAPAAAWLRARRAVVVAVARRLLRRPQSTTVRTVGLAGEIEMAGTVTARVSPGPFIPQPGQSLEDQIVMLARLVNRLREEVVREPQERERVIAAEREARRAELRAEAERLEATLRALRQEFEGLRETTTGGTRLRWEGVPVLLVGIAFTTWPDGIAGGWPAWLPWRPLVLVATGYAAVRVCWAISGPRMNDSSARVGPGALWYGPRR